MRSRFSARLYLCVGYAAVITGPCLTASEQSVCNAAGASRAGFRDRSAMDWIAAENLKRAPYYIKQAMKLYHKGLRQRDGIDKSNNDPFIALYDAQHHVLAALDLAPNNASTWVGAGKATAMIASVDDEAAVAKIQAAKRMFARACAIDAGSLQKIASWASEKKDKEDKALTKVKRSLGKEIKKWKQGGVPVSSFEDIFPVLEERQASEVCSSGAGMDVVEAGGAVAAVSGEEQIRRALSSMSVKPLFPTLLTTMNVGRFFGPAFAEKLASLAITKYTAFTQQHKSKGMTDPNDINDRFFSHQSVGGSAHEDPRAMKFWPELYTSTEYKQLVEFMKQALVEHTRKTGYPLSDRDIQNSHITLWAAVYLEDGGRHGYHVHQSSLSSCVFYAKAPPGKTPIMFMDPRGSPPTHDYEQHIGERDYEPMAPFHHNYHFFAEAGDVVCFPSWLVHRVPSHYEAEERVAFPANLQANRAWDAWYRSATLA